MQPVRLIREVTQPGRCGPVNGQYALQKALRAAAPPWLHVGGVPRDGELPWFWSWEDRAWAARWASAGRALVVGPNVLFADSRRPCRVPAEREICDAPGCRLLFTESAWYRELIERHRGPANRAPIVLWPYPIEPRPGGPLPARHDVLLYVKGDDVRALAAELQEQVPTAKTILYGRYRREELFALARRSRCCLYLSTDDRGPLALAEILLAGCPAAGIGRGAPFIEPERTGCVLERLDVSGCLEAIARCHAMDRPMVAATAAERFDTERIVNTVVAALNAARV